MGSDGEQDLRLQLPEKAMSDTADLPEKAMSDTADLPEKAMSDTADLPEKAMSENLPPNMVQLIT